jgi:hypothetical protein
MRKNLDSRCSALAKTGKPCRAAATAGGLCFFHANPKKASELGCIGGRRKRLSTAENTAPLPKLESVIEVRDAVAQLIADVYGGKMNPRVAANLAPLLNLQLRAIETIDIEQRVARVEKLLAKLDDKGVGRRNNANGNSQAKSNGSEKGQIPS